MRSHHHPPPHGIAAVSRGNRGWHSAIGRRCRGVLGVGLVIHPGRERVPEQRGREGKVALEAAAPGVGQDGQVVGRPSVKILLGGRESELGAAAVLQEGDLGLLQDLFPGDEGGVVVVARLKHRGARCGGGPRAGGHLLAETCAQVGGVVGGVGRGRRGVGHGDRRLHALVSDPPRVAADRGGGGAGSGDTWHGDGHESRHDVIVDAAGVGTDEGDRVVGVHRGAGRDRSRLRNASGVSQLIPAGQPDERRERIVVIVVRRVGRPDAGVARRRAGGGGLRGGGDAGIRPRVTLELGDGEVKGEERVLAGLGLPLGVAGGGGLDPRVGGETDEQQHDERQQGDHEQQREAAPRTAGGGKS